MILEIYGSLGDKTKSFRNGRNYVTHLNVGRFQAMTGNVFERDDIRTF